jgi:hypothetical protein
MTVHKQSTTEIVVVTETFANNEAKIKIANKKSRGLKELKQMCGL